ncbi:MAG: hypothetical protein SFU91_14000 [Chloroherpetonaceae bacterium]|nr:hypothetical protein [Chloroherpetonaceae bacterium]
MAVIEELQNHWHKVYWFSRMLISGDKYGSIGKNNKLLLEITSSLKIISESFKNKSEVFIHQKRTLNEILRRKFEKSSSKKMRIEKLLEDLNDDIQTYDEMSAFILTCEQVVMPLNQAISNIPSNDKIYTESIAKAFLDINGSIGLATIINLWDDLGVKGCLNAERTEIIKAFGSLRVFLNDKLNLGNYDQDIILTAFCQEFERRAGQKRKSRAGGSLEDVTDFILDYYGISRAEAPSHFQADLEVDNWVKCRDGWVIGISCKRTLRERWKNISSSKEIFSRFKVKYIYHVVTFDEDLSDDKLTLLGEQRQIFFLPDNSRKLKYASQHVGLKDYVRPISEFINEIKKET